MCMTKLMLHTLQPYRGVVNFILAQLYIGVHTERPLHKHSPGSLSRKVPEASFDRILRQAALTAVYAFAPGTLLDQHQVGVFQQMNQAMLGAYLQQYEMPPSPDEIQHMRGLIRMLWQELTQQDAHEKTSSLGGNKNSLKGS